jgi:hypothetical protein
MTQFQDPFRAVAVTREETNRQLSGTEITPLPDGSEVQQPGFTDAVAANFRISPTQRIIRGSGILDEIATPIALMLPAWAGGITLDEYDASMPSALDPAFNLEDSLKRLQPKTQDVALKLLENGYLDSIADRSQFDAIISDAMSVQADLETISDYAQTGGFIKSMGAAMTGGIADPIYMIPYGGQAARGAMATSAAARFLSIQAAKGLVGGAAVNLSAKKIVDATSYDLTDLPGATDDMVVAAIGGGFGAAMPVAGYIARHSLATAVTTLGTKGARLPFGLPAWANRWGSQAHLESMFKKMNTLETPMLRQSASQEGADAALRELGGTIQFDLEADRSVRIIDDFIKDARAGKFYPDLSIAPLMRGIDDPQIIAKLERLQRLYKRERAAVRDMNLNAMAAGAPASSLPDPDQFKFRRQAHTAQEDYDRLRLIRAFFEEDVGLQSLPASPIGRLFMDAGDALPTGSTPASRMSGYANLMHDVMRALSGSFSDLTPNDIKLAGGVRSSAEAVKDGLDLALASYNREMLAVMRKHKLAGRFRTRLKEGDEVLREATNLIFDRQAGIAGPVKNPAASELADVMEKYFKMMDAELVDSGLFDANPFGMKHYVPLAIDEAAASRNRDGFVLAAISQFKMLDQAQRPGQIRPDALARAFDRTTDANIKREIIAMVRTHVGDPAFDPKNGSAIRARLEDPGISFLPSDSSIPGTARGAYQDSLEAVYREGADDLFRTITDPFSETKLFESITTAGNPDAFKQRTFTVVSPDMRPFIVSDPVTLMRRYGAQVHGQVGIARAIKMNGDIFGKMKLTDGSTTRGVQNAQDLLRWLGEADNAFNEFLGRAGAGETDSARKAVSAILTDQRATVKRLVGQALYEGGAKPSDAMMFTTRQLSRAALIVNGGMMGVSNLSDISGKLAWTMMHPVRGFPIMFETMAPFANSMRRRDLEFLHMTSQLSMLPRESSEYVLSQRGFGSGIVNQVTGVVDQATEGGSRGFTRLIGLDTINTINGRWGAAIAMDEMVTLSKRLMLARQRNPATAIADSGLTNTQLGRLARLGIRENNVESVLKQIHRYGVHWDKSPAFSGSFDDFLKSDRPVNPLFDRWTGALEERRAFMDNIANESRRVLNVTPGVADRPVMEDTMPMMRIVNQFSSYAYAYNRQKLRPMLQGELGEQAVSIGTQIMLGWLMYASKNYLTDRRSFSDSVAELIEEPQAAAWGAMQDSMVLGNVMRAVGYYDRVAQNFGASTSQLTNQAVAGGTFGSVTRQQQERRVSGPELAFSFLGAGPQLLARGAEAVLSPDSARQDYISAQVSPLQNVVWSRLLNKAGVSERIKDEIGFVPGLVPSDIYRPQRPTLRSR